MAEEALASNTEAALYTSNLDRQVRMFSTEQKTRLSGFLNILEDLNNDNPLTASKFCINLKDDLFTDQVMYDARNQTFTINAKPASVMQVMDLLEHSDRDINTSAVLLLSDNELSSKVHENYTKTAAAWTNEAADNFGKNSLRFMHDVHEVEKLSLESNLDLSANGARQMKEGFFEDMRKNALAMANSISDDIEPEKLVRLLGDVYAVTLKEDPEVSEEYVKNVYPKFIEFIRQKFLELKNGGDNVYEQVISGITPLMKYIHRDISELIQELEEIETKQLENERERIAIEMEAEYKKGPIVRFIKKYRGKMSGFFSKFVEFDLKPNLDGPD